MDRRFNKDSNSRNNGHDNNRQRSNYYGTNEMCNDMGRMRMKDDRRPNNQQFSSRGSRQGTGAYVGRNNRPPRPEPTNEWSMTSVRPKECVAKKELAYNSQKFAPRPDKMVFDMKLGKKTLVVTNYSPVSLPEHKIVLVRYNLEFFQCMKSGLKPSTKKEITSRHFWQVVHRNPTIFRHPEYYIYNDVNILLVCEEYRLPREELNIEIRSEDNKKKLGELHIKFAGCFGLSRNPSMDDDRNHLASVIDAIATSNARMDPNDSPFIGNNNSIFLKNSEDRKSFPQKVAFNLPYGLEALTGLHLSVKMNLRGGPLINFDLTNSVFTNPGYPLIRLLCEVFRGGLLTDEQYEEYLRNELPRLAMSNRNMDQVTDLLRGKYIALMIPNTRMDRKFKMERFAFKSASGIKFTHRNKVVTIQEYYFEEYSYKLKYPQLPCVMGPSTPKSRSPLYPLELLYLHSSAVKFEGAIPKQVLNSLVKSISYCPAQRLAILQEMCNQTPSKQRSVPALISSDQDIMKKHMIRIGNEFIKVNATILPAPTLCYENTKFFDQNNDGVWDNCIRDRINKILTNKSFRTNRTKKIVPILCCVPSRPNEQMRLNMAMFDTLFKVVVSYGQDVCKSEAIYTPIFTFTYATETIHSDLGAVKTSIAHEQKKEDETGGSVLLVPLVLFVFDRRCTSLKNATFNRMSDYAVIKQLCDGEFGIQSQGILMETYHKILIGRPESCSVSHNIALKIFGKIGSTHFMLERGGHHKNWTKLTLDEEPTLILGIDVTHPSAQARKDGTPVERLSVASIVGNLDINITRFRETSRVQNPGQEQIVSMVNEIEERISEFTHCAKKQPAHIVVYRDGIGESDFKRIMHEELASINMAIDNLHFEKKPTLTYIVMTKKHHTRFFPLKRDDCVGEVYNLRPGLLIEDTITHLDYFDFYLQSHYGAIGTSRPAHYYVLHDTWKPSNAFWQTITFALCYNYCRQSRSLSQPAPLMYAHLACARAKDRLNAIYRIRQDRGQFTNLENAAHIAELNEGLKTHENVEGMAFV